MGLLKTIGDMVLILTWLLFMFCMLTSIALAGVFIVCKLIEFIKENLL
jgi:hypothetical protein